MKPTIKFSWTGLLVAPLLVPSFFSIALTLANPPRSPLVGFLFILIPGGLVSYGVTGLLFVPGLHALARFVKPTLGVTGLWGAVLGVIVFVPIAFMQFLSSGPNSGAPVDTFWEYLWQSRSDSAVWVFPIGGAITALVYWFFARRAADNASLRELGTSQ